MAEPEDFRSLEYTPTWAVATVCTVFVTVSLLVLFGIEKLEEWLSDRNQNPLLQALLKMKEELMVLGFISLMLSVFQDYVASICVKSSSLDHWTPCALAEPEAGSEAPAGGDRRRLLALPLDALFTARFLRQDEPKACKSGYEPFVWPEGLHQLHAFIFVLACVHVVYSLWAMGLAAWKVRGWKAWEDEAQKQSPEESMGITRELTMRRQSTFIQHHTSTPWKTNKITVWVVCFFRQFGLTVTKSDYLSLRLGFIASHNTGHKFNFHRYMMRSLEDEFRRVVGISRSLWCLVVLFVLFNVNGSNLYFVLSFVPVLLVLLLGTKQQHIIATLALENAGVTQGGHLAGKALRPRDDLFWFKRPFVHLWLIHFILFENAFEMATVLWYLWEFGYSSCLLKGKAYVYVRISLGCAVQILCSYSTLPLYAIVTQMGSHYKKAIFEIHVQDKLGKWRKGAKMRAKQGIPILGPVPEGESGSFYDLTIESGGSQNGGMSEHDPSRGDKIFESQPCLASTEDQSGSLRSSESPEISQQQSPHSSEELATIEIAMDKNPSIVPLAPLPPLTNSEDKVPPASSTSKAI